MSSERSEREQRRRRILLASGDLVLEVRGPRASVRLVRVSVRGYVLVAHRNGKLLYELGPVGVPTTRWAAIEHALGRARELGLVQPGLWERVRARQERLEREVPL